MIEVERKYRLTSSEHTSILAWMDQGGHPPQTQADAIFLQVPSFAEFTPGDPVVRIRTAEDNTLTLKRRRETRSSLELETTVSDALTAGQILEELGLYRVTHVSKSRRSGRFGDVTISLDEVDGLGPFLELEVVVESEDNVQSALETIANAASSLGITKSQIEYKKYDELLAPPAVESAPVLQVAETPRDEGFQPVIERERKFLVSDTSITAGAAWEEITQAYIFSLDGFAVRIRRVQERLPSGKLAEGRAWMTGKGPRIGAAREEYDSEVSPAWAQQVIGRSANVVRKRRYQVVTDQTWEVDEFLGDNAGLWIAELEGGPEIHSVRLPSWVSREIINETEYNNEELAVRPFGQWTLPPS